MDASFVLYYLQLSELSLLVVKVCSCGDFGLVFDQEGQIDNLDVSDRDEGLSIKRLLD